MALFNFGTDEQGNIDRATGGPKTQQTTQAPVVDQQTTTPDQTKSNEPELSGFDKLNALLYPEKTEGKESSDDSNDSNPTPAPIDPTKIFEDPKAIEQIMGSMDFTKNISDDTLKLLEANDPKGMHSLVNDTSKAAFLEALKFSSHLNKQVVDDAVKRAVEQSKGQIDESLGDYELNQAMPEISNPVIRLGLDAVKAQLKAQNPSMPSKELATHLRTYLEGANKIVNPGSDPKTPDKKSDESWLDWADT